MHLKTKAPCYIHWPGSLIVCLGALFCVSAVMETFVYFCIEKTFKSQTKCVAIKKKTLKNDIH